MKRRPLLLLLCASTLAAMLVFDSAITHNSGNRAIASPDSATVATAAITIAPQPPLVPSNDSLFIFLTIDAPASLAAAGLHRAVESLLASYPRCRLRLVTDAPYPHSHTYRYADTPAAS